MIILAGRRKLPVIVVMASLASACSGGSGSASFDDGAPPAPPSLTVTTTSLPNGAQNVLYSQTLQASGGTRPYTWSVTGSLPLGLALTSDGGITGTPLNATTSTLDVNVHDASSPQLFVRASISLRIVAALKLFTSGPSGQTNVGRDFQMNISRSGGISPFNWTLQAGSGPLPPGLTMTGNSEKGDLTISGIPMVPGSYSFTLQLQDTGPPQQTAIQPVSLDVANNLAIQSFNLPPGAQGVPYSALLQAAGGQPPYNWSLAPLRALPAGLQLSTTGAVSGVPTLADIEGIENPVHYGTVATVTDSATPQHSVATVLSFLIYRKARISTSFLPTVTANTPVSIQLAASGGIGQYTWTLLSQNLPSGIAFSAATGAISGQTSHTGSFAVTVQATDAGPPVQTSDTFALQLSVVSSLPRNNSPFAATPLSNGTYYASVSPLSDPPTGIVSADIDYYAVSANAGNIVTVETTAHRLTPRSPVDTVLEFVDLNDNQLALCIPAPFICVNDDFTGAGLDSRLALEVPPGNSGPLTFYIKVLDFRGDARPDFRYTLTISGAN
jgi:hypothetical protein